MLIGYVTNKTPVNLENFTCSVLLQLVGKVHNSCAARRPTYIEEKKKTLTAKSTVQLLVLYIVVLELPSVAVLCRSELACIDI